MIMIMPMSARENPCDTCRFRPQSEAPVFETRRQRVTVFLIVAAWALAVAVCFVLAAVLHAEAKSLYAELSWRWSNMADAAEFCDSLRWYVLGVPPAAALVIGVIAAGASWAFSKEGKAA